MLRELAEQRAAAAEKMGRIVVAAEGRALTKRQASDFEEARETFDDLGEELWFYGAEQVGKLEPAAAVQRATELVAVDRTVGWDHADRRMTTQPTPASPAKRTVAEPTSALDDPELLIRQARHSRNHGAVRSTRGTLMLLEQARFNALGSARDLLDTAELERRQLTVAENAEYHRLLTRHADLNREIGVEERLYKAYWDYVKNTPPPPGVPVGG